MEGDPHEVSGAEICPLKVEMAYNTLQHAVSRDHVLWAMNYNRLR